MNTDKLKFHPGVFFTPFLFILTMWLVAYANWKLVLDYVEYGIFPREIWGLKGILFSPFIHGDISHITNNSIALIVLLSMVAFFYRKNYLTVIILGWLLSGLLTWLIGRPSFHIGASGLVYVLTAYLFFSGLKTKYYRLMAASLVVVMLYGGSVWYMFPNVKDGISWEGHLSGFIIGLLLAFLLPQSVYEPTYKYDWQRPDYDASNDSFMQLFDEEGNFNPPKPVEENTFEQDENGYFYGSSTQPIHVQYIITGSKEKPSPTDTEE